MIGRNHEGLILALEKLFTMTVAVATMCSRTEAPLLMVDQIIDLHRVTVGFMNHAHFDTRHILGTELYFSWLGLDREKTCQMNKSLAVATRRVDGSLKDQNYCH